MGNLEADIRARLRAMVEMEVSPEERDEYMRGDSPQEWWDFLDPNSRDGILGDLGVSASVISKAIRKKFNSLDKPLRSELEAYWNNEVKIARNKGQKKRSGSRSKTESMLGERFTSSSARAAGKESAASLGALAAGDESFIRSRIKSTAWKKVIGAIDDIHSEIQKKGKKAGKQDVANVLAMMIRQEIGKETT